jgi:hypothetical protein
MCVCVCIHTYTCIRVCFCLAQRQLPCGFAIYVILIYFFPRICTIYHICNSILFVSADLHHICIFFPPRICTCGTLASHDHLCLYGINGTSAIPQKPDAAHPTFDLCTACSETGVGLRSMQVLCFYFTFVFAILFFRKKTLLARRPK